MSAQVLDGKRLAAVLRSEIASEVKALSTEAGIVPGLEVILAGDDPASQVYVRNKARAAEKVGIRSNLLRMPEDVDTGAVLAEVRRRNENPEVHGILVQLPLPAQVDQAAVLDAVDPRKDVDGFHPVNVGRLWQGRPTLVPCTPTGIVELLRRSGIPLEGSRAVVLGRSNIVGKPMAALLLAAHATVTVCHSRTRDLPAVAREADILVAAVGRPAMVTREFVRPGAAVVDVGTHRIESEDAARRLFPDAPDRLAAVRERGSTLVGDVHPEVREVAGWLSPVPGGVGPLTVALLLRNTLQAARSFAAADR
ncbi:MAG: bifunctional methylenetetrahydrofolate dehydrogenase/methenyltetrahydrofolate cyclohydrolase FolD [Acidobacteriota bacterium]|jgi:methylenetetrahydrofolate dehydrogenase (NADP+)/methenyltetrahydrofolate cyclohydrolase